MKLSYDTYKRILFAATTVIIVNIVQPTSFFKAIGLAVIIGLVFGVAATIIETKFLKK